MLFTGKSGRLYGYNDEWEDGTFRYFGEGRIGDMRLARGNASIRDHAAQGKELHVFDSIGKGYVRYRGRMACAGFDIEDVRDRKGVLRKAVVFNLVPASNDIIEPRLEEEFVNELGKEVPRSWFWKAPLEELRASALQPPTKGLDPLKAKRNLYHRSESVKVYVQRRANGKCEGCGSPAPFVTPEGRPYLEPHHTRRLSDGGPDHVAWVVAVCPTCHRRAHYSNDAKEYNAKLIRIVNRLEDL